MKTTCLNDQLRIVPGHIALDISIVKLHELTGRLLDGYWHPLMYNAQKVEEMHRKTDEWLKTEIGQAALQAHMNAKAQRGMREVVA